MARLFGILVILHELDKTVEGEKIWREAKVEYWSGLKIVYMACKNAEPKSAWYAILNGIADLIPFLSSMWEAADMPVKYPCMIVESP